MDISNLMEETMGYNENIERMLQEDIRDKRRTGNGVYSKRGKGVKHGISGALRTSYYFMTSKERKKLNGEVKVFNMNEILSKEEFFSMDEDTQKMLLTNWRETYQNVDILKAMGISSNTLSKLLKELNVPSKPRGGKRAATSKRKAKTQTPQVENTNLELIMPQPQEQPIVKPIILTKGLNLEYNGEFDAEHISKVFTKLQLLIEGEENKFNVSISITERT
jgi:hypothetical protein